MSPIVNKERNNKTKPVLTSPNMDDYNEYDVMEPQCDDCLPDHILGSINKGMGRQIQSMNFEFDNQSKDDQFKSDERLEKKYDMNSHNENNLNYIFKSQERQSDDKLEVMDKEINQFKIDINKINLNLSPEHLDLNEESNPNFDCIQEMIDNIDHEMESDLNKHDEY